MLTLRASEKLQVVLGEDPTTEAPITVEYDDTPNDRNRGNTRTADAITAATVAVDVLTGLNSGRRVVGFSLHNADGSAITPTVRFVNASGTTRIVWKGTLQTGETLYWSPAQGWYQVTANGALKTDGATSSATSVALSAAESAATRASVALSAATSLDTATDTAFSTGDSAAVSAATSLNTAGSTATSTALSKAVSDDLAQSVDISTALSTALSAAESA